MTFFGWKCFREKVPSCKIGGGYVQLRATRDWELDTYLPLNKVVLS